MPEMQSLPAPETLLAYASILEKPQFYVHQGVKLRMPQGEPIKAAIAALRHCAALKAAA